MAGDDAGEWLTNELPASWCWADFSTFFSDYTDSHRKVPQKSYRPDGRLAVVDQGAAKIGGYTDNLSMQSRVPLPAIVFGDHTRAVKFIDIPFAQGADGVRVLVANSYIEPVFAYQALRCIELPDKGYSRHFKFLKASNFPLAPLAEQQRIVAKIDSLTGKSKRARDHLDHIPRLVEKYKQTVLAAAFRGDLTKEWRTSRVEAVPSFARVEMERRGIQEAHQQRLHPCDSPEVPGGSEPFEVPSNWAWVRAETICGFITKGTTPPSSQMSASDDVPFIKVYNLTFDGTLDFTVEPTFVSKVTHDGFLARSKVIPGDVLMNIVGPPLGKVSIVPDELPEWNINQAIAVFRPVPSVSSAFLAKWLLTEVLTQWAISKSKATAGQSNLTLEICRNLPIPFCSLAEQHEVVRRIQNAFTWIDRLASEATSARKLVDRLDQAVLAKAFRGELVPQDPADEPASVLLGRIRAERDVAPKARRGRKAKAA